MASEANTGIATRSNNTHSKRLNDKENSKTIPPLLLPPCDPYREHKFQTSSRVSAVRPAGTGWRINRERRKPADQPQRCQAYNSAMSTKIGLISDLHATPAPAQEALTRLAEAGADRILCAGDIAGYGDELDRTIELLTAHGCEAICGNHELWYQEASRNASGDPLSRFLGDLPAVINTTIAGRSLYMVHASPPQSCLDGIKLLDENGNIIPEQRQEWSERLAGFGHDVLIVGHTHQVFSERLGDTLVINPGSTKFNHSCMILSVPELECTVIPLSGKPVIRAWNWGMETITPPERR